MNKIFNITLFLFFLSSSLCSQSNLKKGVSFDINPLITQLFGESDNSNFTVGLVWQSDSLFKRLNFAPIVNIERQDIGINDPKLNQYGFNIEYEHGKIRSISEKLKFAVTMSYGFNMLLSNSEQDNGNFNFRSTSHDYTLTLGPKVQLFYMFLPNFGVNTHISLLFRGSYQDTKLIFDGFEEEFNSSNSYQLMVNPPTTISLIYLF